MIGIKLSVLNALCQELLSGKSITLFSLSFWIVIAFI